jgi:hypothetical protein
VANPSSIRVFEESKWTGAPFAAGMVGLVVFAARLWFVQRNGSAIPFWDQWDAEALGIYKPWLTSTLQLNQLAAAHNEHRILFTRLADLALLALTGTWNPWLQLVLNAALQAGTAAIVTAVLWPALRGMFQPALAAGLAIFFAAPADWQNALWGFQSQFYFADLFAVLAFAGVAQTRAFSRRWWLSGSAALAAIFTEGGGCLAAFAIGAAALLLASFRPRQPKIWAALLLAATVGLVGILLRVTVPEHAMLDSFSWC